MPKTKNKRFFIHRFGSMTIATRITLLYGGVFAVVIMLASFFIMFNTNFYYRDLSQKELDQTADKVVEYIQTGDEITEEALRNLNPNKYVEIRVFNIRDRRILVRFPDGARDDAFPEPPPIDEDAPADENMLGMAVEGRKIRTSKAGFPRHMFDQRLVAYGDETYIVQVYRRYAMEHQILKLFIVLFVSVNVLGIVGAFSIGRYISRLMLKPITNIRQTAERISIEDLSRRIPVEGPDDELKELSLTFNDMIDRLEASFVKQNQFVSDASHELRTPISVIQGYVNLIDRWGKKDVDILQESIDSIKTETEHMATLVKKLLFLAKGEQNKIALQSAPLSLNSLAADVAKEMAVMEQNANISVEDLSEETIYGDYDLIKQMLWIFIENCIKYANPENEGMVNIIIKIYQKEDKSCISVIDDGIGISQEDLPLIFERFYRADKSRSNEVPGTGLGLSIAWWIIKQHDAVTDIKSVVGQGTEMTVCFPIYTIY